MLTLIEDLGMLYATETSKRKYRFGHYRCDCGNEIRCMVSNVTRGTTQSCGCYNVLRTIAHNSTHGLTKHVLYPVWRAMIRRVTNKKDSSYPNYGGLGITIEDRWFTIENFIEDMGATYVEGLTLDRIDPEGSYCKDNCRWANATTQNRNTRRIRSNNTSGYRGVSYNKRNNRWFASIRVNKVTKHLGHFDTPLDAAIAYDKYVQDNDLEHTTNGFILEVKEVKNETGN